MSEFGVELQYYSNKIATDIYGSHVYGRGFEVVFACMPQLWPDRPQLVKYIMFSFFPALNVLYI